MSDIKEILVQQLEEDAPANAVGDASHVAGLDDNPPAKKKKKKKKNSDCYDCYEEAPPGEEEWIKANKKRFIDQYGEEEGLKILYATAWKRHNNKSESFDLDEEDNTRFAGCKVFDVDTNTFMQARYGKGKRDRYSKYVGSGDVGEEIRQYGRKNPRENVVLRDRSNGAMLYLRKIGENYQIDEILDHDIKEMEKIYSLMHDLYGALDSYLNDHGNEKEIKKMYDEWKKKGGRRATSLFEPMFGSLYAELTKLKKVLKLR